MSQVDIIEKCREHEERFAKQGDHRTAHYFGEAADEIERLRWALEEIAQTRDGEFSDCQMRDTASAALTNEQKP